LSVLAAISLFVGGFNAWQGAIPLPWIGIVGMGAMLTAMVLAVLAATAPDTEQLRRIDVATLVAGLCVLAGWATSHLYFTVGYGTDEAAFVHRSAQLLLTGVNPYGADLSDALNTFHVPIHYSTMLMDGNTAASLSYPPLPILLTAAAIPLTGGVQSVPVVTLVALAASTVLGYLLLPVPWRPLAVVSCVGLPIMFWFATSGLITLVALPFLIVAAAGWTRVGAGGVLGRSGVGRAVCLGLAAASQPLAWFVVPFAVAGLWLLRRGQLDAPRAARLTLRYTLIAAAVFAAVNLPFVVWDPGAWLHGITETLTQHAIPLGQGAVALSLYFGLGGGAVDWFNYAGALTGLGLFALYLVWFRRLGPAAWILPWLAFFPASRSLAGYFMLLVPLWLVSVLTTRQEEFTRAARLPWPRPGGVWARRPALVLFAVLIPALAAITVAFATPQPLRLEVTGMQTGGQLQSVWQLRVKVTNTSTEPLRPQFATNPSGYPSTRWNILAGPPELPAGDTAEYQLAAANRGSMPAMVTPFVVHAYTAAPRTVSSSARVAPQPFTVTLKPDYVNAPQRPGQTVTVTAALRAPSGALVRQAGVRVALGQIVYAEAGPLAGEANINNADQGRSPGFATTGPDGLATFQLRCASTQPRPIYFQAWIEETGGYPFGYSEVVSVLWVEVPP
jgi:hypothetical protein